MDMGDVGTASGLHLEGASCSHSLSILLLMRPRTSPDILDVSQNRRELWEPGCSAQPCNHADMGDGQRVSTFAKQKLFDTFIVLVSYIPETAHPAGLMCQK